MRRGGAVSGVKVQGQSAVTRSRRCGIVESDGNVDGEMSVRLAGRLLARRTAPPRVGLLQSLTAPSFLAKRTLCSPSGEPPKFGGWRGRRQLPTLSAIRAFDAADLENARIDLMEALKLIGTAESTDARRSELLRLLATTHLRLGSPLEAEDCLEVALDIEERSKAMSGEYAGGKSAHLEARFLMGVVAQKLYRLEEAEKQLTSVLADDDTHWRARFHLALVRLSAEEPDFDEAEALLTRVLADEPTHPTAQTMLDKLRERRAAAELKLTAFDGDDIAKGTSGA